MSFCKKPCNTCPFRQDVTPFLHPERAYGIAASAQNPYQDFPCHKTFKYTDEDDEGNDIADMSESKTCAGFLTMRAQLGETVPTGFLPSYDMCYIDPEDMYEAYQDEWYDKKTVKNEQ